MDKDNIIQQLSINNYKDFISSYNIEKDAYLSNLSCKLDQSLFDKRGRTNRQQTYEMSRRRVERERNSMRDMVMKEISNLSNSLFKGVNSPNSYSSSKNKRSKEQEWMDKSQAKNIKDILGDLNGKLKKCRQKHTRDYNL